MDNQKRVLITSAVVVAAVLAILAYFYLKPSPPPVVPEVRSLADSSTQGTVPSLGEAINPVADQPDITPTSRTNPFDSVKTNPFE